MDTYKMCVTRPMFLKQFLAACKSTDEEELEKVIPGQSKLIYAAYTVLMEHDFSEDDIKKVHCDGESVMVQLASKSLAKQVREACHREEVRLGMYYYTLKFKVKDQYVYVTAVQGRRVDEEEED